MSRTNLICEAGWMDRKTDYFRLACTLTQPHCGAAGCLIRDREVKDKQFVGGVNIK